MEKEILNQLTALGHPQRMAIFRLLMRRFPDGVPAGELARALDIKASTMSMYLAGLARAGLVAQRRSGTSLFYTVEMEAARGLVSYLFFDCCRGRADLCAPLTGPSQPSVPAVPDRKLNVLFICTGNSVRSLFAEAILRQDAGDRFNAFSAGTHPYAQPNPLTIEVLQGLGHDVSSLRSKSLDEFQTPGATDMDFVITVCDQAANEDCPSWAGQPFSAHWGVPDPARAEGSLAERTLAFRQAYGALRNRISAFSALSFDALERASLQNLVDDIGRYGRS